MTGLIRKAVFLALGSGFIASAAMAGLPGWSLSTQPGFIKIGGKVGSVTDLHTSATTAAPTTASTFTIHDASNLAVFNTRVRIDFSGCSDVILCPTQDAGLTIVGSTIEGLTDINGLIAFHIRGRSFGLGAPGVGAATPCAVVTLPDNPSAGSGNLLRVGIYNSSGLGAPSSNDLSIWLSDANAAAYRSREDLNGDLDGNPRSNDLSQWLAAALGGYVGGCP